LRGGGSSYKSQSEIETLDSEWNRGATRNGGKIQIHPPKKGETENHLPETEKRKKGKDGRYLEIFRVEGRKRLCSFFVFFPPML
jgi:hypothetical protein